MVPHEPRRRCLTDARLTAARLAWKTARHLGVVAVTWMATACGGAANPTPTSPGDPVSGDVVGLDVSCPASLLIGERGPCLAVAHLRSGSTPLVTFDATWSSTRPEVVAVDAIGVVNGRSAGQAVISARYGGRDGNTVSILVIAQDAVRVRAAAEQGDFRRGSTVTMWLQGYYSVASAETGQLSLRISDQDGPIATASPLPVAKGGDFFLLSSTFVIPQRSTQVCRTAILEVGSVTVAEPTSNASGLWCISIQP